MASPDQSSVGSAPVRQRSKMWQSVRHRIRSPSIKSSSTLETNAGNLSVASYKDYQLSKQVSLKSVNAAPIRKSQNEKPTRRKGGEGSTSKERSLIAPSGTKAIRSHPNDDYRTRVSHHQQTNTIVVSPQTNPEIGGGSARQRSNSWGSFYGRYEQEMTYHHDDPPVEDESPDFSLGIQTGQSSENQSFDLLERLSCVAMTQLITDYASAVKSQYIKAFSCGDNHVDVMDLRYSAGGWLKNTVFSGDLTKHQENDPTSKTPEYGIYAEGVNPVDDTSLYTYDSSEKSSVGQSTLFSSVAPSDDEEPSFW